MSGVAHGAGAYDAMRRRRRWQTWTDSRRTAPSLLRKRSMTDALISTVLSIVATFIDLYVYVIIAAVIASWLVAFSVINVRNDFVRSALNALHALTEPVFRLVRRVIPPVAGFDFSPLIILIALFAILRFLHIAFADYPNWGPLI